MRLTITVDSVVFSVGQSEDGRPWVRANITPEAGDEFAVFADRDNIATLRALKQGAKLAISIVGDKKTPGGTRVYLAGVRGPSVEGEALNAAFDAVASLPPRPRKPAAAPAAPAAAPTAE